MDAPPGLLATLNVCHVAALGSTQRSPAPDPRGCQDRPWPRCQPGVRLRRLQRRGQHPAGLLEHSGHAAAVQGAGTG